MDLDKSSSLSPPKTSVSFWTVPMQSKQQQQLEKSQPNNPYSKEETQTLDAILHSKALAKRLQNLRVGSGYHRKNLYQKRLKRTLPWTWLSDLKGPPLSRPETNPQGLENSSNQERQTLDIPSKHLDSSFIEKRQEESHRLQKHLYMPYVIAGYLQLIFNMVIVAIVLLSLLSIAWSIRNDIVGKVMEQTIEAQAIVRRCYNDYVDNKCNETQSIPLLRQQCHTWYVCMTRDPKSIGSKTKLYAETLSEVLNSFVEPISYRTLSFILVLLLGFTLVSNLAFHFAKKKSPHPFEYKQVDQKYFSHPKQVSKYSQQQQQQEEEERDDAHWAAIHWKNE
ncbi:Nucleus export protein brr6 [Galdieria sulphuraria]|nr:Nucleus export protein brr6 [Galdieria sulphuraria]